MKKWGLFLLFALSLALVEAQPKLGVGAGRALFGFQDTVCRNSTVSYNLYIKNKGNAVFSGAVLINAAVDTGLGYTNIGYDSVLVASLAPGDSFQFTRTQNYSNPNYRLGGNIVVIWPSGSSALTADSSLPRSVYVLLCASVEETDEKTTVTVFPNPCTDYVYIQTQGKKSIPQTVLVLDNKGALLETHVNTSVIPLKKYPEGLYILRVKFSDGSVKMYRLVRIE